MNSCPCLLLCIYICAVLPSILEYTYDKDGVMTIHSTSKIALGFVTLTVLTFFLACGGGTGEVALYLMLDDSDGDSSGGAGVNLTQAAPRYSRSTVYFVNTTSIDINITAEVAESTIRYTTDGSDPSCSSSTVYAPPLTISDTSTVKAISCLSGYDDSPVATGVFIEVIPDVNVIPGAGTPIAVAIGFAIDGDIVNVPAGVYTENLGELAVNKNITLIGAGSGSDPATNTIIANAIGNGNYVIDISVGGTSDQPTALRNMRIINGTGAAGNDSTGVMITAPTGYIELDNIAANDNDGDGVAFNPGGSPHYQGFVVKNSDFSGNGNQGFRIPTYVSIELSIDNCTFSNNVRAGFESLSQNLAATNISITNSSFYNNASLVYQFADIYISKLAGTLSLSDVSIISNSSESGIRITGAGNTPTGLIAVNSIALNSVTISGTQQSLGTYPSGALVITRYLGLANLVMNDVILNSSAPNGLFLGTITPGAGPNPGNLKLGVNFSYDISLGTHGNSGGYTPTDIAIDATGAIFVNAVDDAEIESSVWHSVDDAALGTITWTTP